MYQGENEIIYFTSSTSREMKTNHNHRFAYVCVCVQGKIHIDSVHMGHTANICRSY
jgi:hypothetical protein